MTLATELHVQAALWAEHGWRFAALFLEGEVRGGAADRADAVLRVTKARGLRLVTDPDQVPLPPVGGWRVEIEPAGTPTLRWPHFTPLLDAAPVAAPDGWLDAAREHGIVLVFAGRGLGLHEHAADGDAHPGAVLDRVSQDGALAGAAVVVAGREDAARGIDGTTGHPVRVARHRPRAGASAG